MNRAERRRRMREGENVVVEGRGRHAPITEAKGQMPAKRAGEHRWIAAASFTVKDPGAAGLKFLDTENMVYVGLGCWDCEQVWSDTVNPHCPARGDDS